MNDRIYPLVEMIHVPDNYKGTEEEGDFVSAKATTIINAKANVDRRRFPKLERVGEGIWALFYWHPVGMELSDVPPPKHTKGGDEKTLPGGGEVCVGGGGDRPQAKGLDSGDAKARKLDSSRR